MTMGEPEQNFLSRWSRRKAQVRQGGEPPAQEALPVSTAVAAELAPADASGTAPPSLPAVVQASAEAQPEVPRPTLADVQALTQESDFSRFVARDVDPEVKNLAMKKLFADPHYNVMDGLDTYIADYNTPDPIPAAMFKQLVQARMLGLLDDELEDQVPEAGSAAQATDVPPVADADPDQVLAEDAAEQPGAEVADAEVANAEVADATEALEAPPVVGGRAWESNPPGTA
jgi:hypothetical protein